MLFYKHIEEIANVYGWHKKKKKNDVFWFENDNGFTLKVQYNYRDKITIGGLIGERYWRKTKLSLLEFEIHIINALKYYKN